MEMMVIIFFAFSIGTLCSEDVWAISPKMDGLSEKKAHLSLLYDSLDLQKQMFKRNGLSVSEIERHQAEIKDSLVILKNYIYKQSTTKPSPLKKDQKSPIKFVNRPRDIFDWTVIIVAIVAVFSGIMLCIGIIRRILCYQKNRNQKKRKNHSQKTAAPVREAMASVYPENKKDTIPQKAYDHDQKDTVTDSISNNDPIERLRQKVTTAPVDHDEKSKKQLISDVVFQGERDGIVSSDIEQQVLTAAREGLDIAAISRKFHLSSDHVSLIVKIGGINK